MTQQQYSVSFGWQPTYDLTSPVRFGGQGWPNEPWILPEVGIPGRAAWEVGTDDGQQQKKEEKKKQVPSTENPELGQNIYMSLCQKVLGVDHPFFGRKCFFRFKFSLNKPNFI